MWPMLLAPTRRGLRINKGVLKISGCKMSCSGNNTDNFTHFWGNMRYMIFSSKIRIDQYIWISYVSILANRPFSLVDFVFPMQIMWRYSGEYFISKLDIFMLARSLLNEIKRIPFTCHRNCVLCHAICTAIEMLCNWHCKLLWSRTTAQPKDWSSALSSVIITPWKYCLDITQCNCC